MENSYALFYVEANIVCIILFLIMLLRSIKGIDRQMKQNIFNKVMVYHVLYFISDIIWELVATGFIVKNRWTVTIPNLSNAILLFCLTYYWFYYIEVSQGAKYILNKRNITLTLAGGIIPIDISIFLFLFFPQLMINPDYTTTIVYQSLFVVAPIFYTMLAAAQSLHRAFKKENYVFFSHFLMCGFYPIMLVVFGVCQILFLKAPIFCFGTTTLMVYVYIASLDNLVSIDPLTGLNNRAQLKRYVAQESAKGTQDNQHFIIMLDLNRFKAINDNYGHYEGDKAIIKAAEAIKTACGSLSDLRPFISRYGGDEFMVIIRTDDVKDVEHIESRIKEALEEENMRSKTPYQLSASIGHAPYNGDVAEFVEALNKADEALYKDKTLAHQAAG